MSNRLATSNSPYLLQHADNPVQWWEWSDEAFAEAVQRDVPVFLSVGYSSCHWCHVMAHESFEDLATADLLNEHFVSIKVDREVRPDVDAVYMAATQALTGQGGWPMSVWLDHQRRPFHAGTYFPPEPLHGRPSFRQVLTSIAEAWRTRRDEVLIAATEITAALQAHNDRSGAGPATSSVVRNAAPRVPEADGVATGAAQDQPPAPPSAPPDAAALESAAHLVVTRAWDRDLGGFGRAPKFPQAMTIQWLLEHHVVTGDPVALEAAVSSLLAMARGGIHDHVVGGFARYSTDARWLLPHFEKMLSDNGLLLECYATAAAITGSRELLAAAEGVAGWLLDDMQSPDGGFFSALDADTDGHEGATTVWTDAEFREVVAAAGVDADLAAAWFGVRPAGNFRPERGVPSGDNILHTPMSLEDFAGANGVEVETWQVQVRTAMDALARRRADRRQPGLDDKVTVAWNALAIRGLARAAALHGRPEWADAALRAVEFIRTHMRTEEGELLHVHRGGTSWVPAFLDDEAGLAVALFELAPVVGRDDLVAWAVELVDHAVATFGDGTGGYATTPSDASDLPLRPRDAFDNAQPAGTSSLAQAAVRAARVTGERRHADVAIGILAAGHDAAIANPTGFGELLRAAQFLAADQREVAIVGPPGPRRDALAAAVVGMPRPGVVTVVGSGESDPVVPLLVGRSPGDDTPRAWVCREFACHLPVTTPADVLAQLDE